MGAAEADKVHSITADRIDQAVTTAIYPASLRSALLTYSEKVIALEATNAALTPKAEVYDRLLDADGSVGVFPAHAGMNQISSFMLTF